MKTDIEELLHKDPYSMGKEEKERMLSESLLELTEFHRKNCAPYARIF